MSTPTDLSTEASDAIPQGALFARLLDSGLSEELIRDHLQRMEPVYFERYEPDTIARHIAMIGRLDADNLVELNAETLGDGEWRVTIVGFDYMAEVSTISGLMAANSLGIIDGDVFTYAEAAPADEKGPSYRPSSAARRRRRSGNTSSRSAPPSSLALRKIVDIFHVRSDAPSTPAWLAFEQSLEDALRLLRDHRMEEARSRINLQVVDYLRQTSRSSGPLLLPVHISIDNDVSPSATRLLIEGQDTPAFLYALSTALALRDVNIVRIRIETDEEDVRDTVDVTDRRGNKITAPEKIYELRFVVVLIKQFTHLLTQAPNPARALAHFNHLIDQIMANVRSGREMEAIFHHLEKQRVIGAMAKLFGTTDFLWEDFLRMQYHNLFPVLQDIDAVRIRKSTETMERQLMARLSRIRSFERRKAMLNRYKDREMFRIDMRQILSEKEDFLTFSQELTDLAEVVLNAAWRICDDQLRKKHGQPCSESGELCGFSICALGKCGGREMGWASDIELLFAYSEQGKTDGPSPLLNSEYFERLTRMICDTVVSRREGIFEIDLRLRPYGDKGALASSFDIFSAYFNEKGGALPFERPALIKLRVIGGDDDLGRCIEASRDAFVYNRSPLDLTTLAHLRERQNNELVKPGSINVKYSYGGVIDIEYYVQGLQIQYGADDVSVRSPNTLIALSALHRGGYILDEDFRLLSDAYIFLRRLINALRIVRGHAKDLVLPEPDSQEFRFLARRLGYTETGDHPTERLVRDIRQYMEWAAQAHRSRFIHKLFA